MSSNNRPVQPEQPSSSPGHLSVRPDNAGPREMRFLLEQQEKRLGGALGLSVLSHAALAGLIALIAYLVPPQVYESILPQRLSDEIVWLVTPGPGGGGGGGGNEMAAPPRPAELPKPPEPAPAPPPPEPVPDPPEPEPEPEPIDIPARTLTAPAEIVPGTVESTQASLDVSQGIGRGGGGGSGEGTGVGAGDGAGIGDGFDRGAGGGVYRPGSGITLPTIIHQVRPAYTAEAMRAKVQGVVVLECVVMPDGSVGEIDIVKSLDSTFGLDQEAIKAARQWRFAPGLLIASGQAVPVLVTIELTFTLR